ncbi:MAG: hypothetical protein KME45_08915 [Stenomitos rutilans HA7619-LM2]|jgi:hypothetical protein|nr:hypothetical protein [Stenomitos rutilans HA7619-LM2]
MAFYIDAVDGFGLWVGSRSFLRLLHLRHACSSSTSTISRDCRDAIDQYYGDNPLFMSALFGTAFACLVLAVSVLLKWQQSVTVSLLVDALFYLVVTIDVTIACNVPLNDALAAAALFTGLLLK